jgi:hypothetical protein
VDQAIFTGEFNDDMITGQGEFSWANGNKYVGEWLNNRMHGKGVYYYKDGRSYTGNLFNFFTKGDFFNDLREG